MANQGHTAKWNRRGSTNVSQGTKATSSRPAMSTRVKGSMARRGLLDVGAHHGAADVEADAGGGA